jgi:hypothetical protein
MAYLGGSFEGAEDLFTGDLLPSSIVSSAPRSDVRFRFEEGAAEGPGKSSSSSPPEAAFVIPLFRQLLKLSNPRLAFSGSTPRWPVCSNARLTTRLWMSDIVLLRAEEEQRKQRRQSKRRRTTTQRMIEFFFEWCKSVMKLSSNGGSDHDIEAKNRHNLHFRYHQNSRSTTRKSGEEHEERRACIGCFSKRGKGRPMRLLPAFADWKGLFHPWQFVLHPRSFLFLLKFIYFCCFLIYLFFIKKLLLFF